MAEHEDQRPPGQLVDIIRRVSFLRGTAVSPRNAWAMAVLAKLHEIEVFTIRDFIEGSQSVNRRLRRREHKPFHFTTMTLLLRTACDEIFGEVELVSEVEMEQNTTDDEDEFFPDGHDEHEQAVEEVRRIIDGVQVGADWRCVGRGEAVVGGVYAPQADV